MSTLPEVATAAQAVEDAAPPGLQPPSVAQPGSLVTPWRIGIALGLAGLAALPGAFGGFGFFVGQYALVYAILGLSVTVVSGYTGLISLLPYTLAGIGAMVTGVAVAAWGWPFFLAVPLAALATVPVSAAVAMASVRLKGLYLAIATLTFADALGETFFRWDRATGGPSGWIVQKPKLGPFGFTSDAGYYALCLVTVLVLVWMIEGLRTSKLGRAMLAVRDNEIEAQALGINVYKTKLAAFTIGGMMAGIGGAFLAGLLTSVTRSAFQSPFAEATSVLLVTVVVVGGIDHALGAFLGAAALVVQQQIFQGADFFFAFFGVYSALLLILFLIYRPGGLVQVGRMQMRLIRRRPVFGSTVAIIVLGINVGVAWLFLRFS